MIESNFPEKGLEEEEREEEEEEEGEREEEPSKPKSEDFKDEDDDEDETKETADSRQYQKTAKAFFEAVRTRTRRRIKVLYRQLDDIDFVIEAFEGVMKEVPQQSGKKQIASVTFARSLIYGKNRLAQLSDMSIASILAQIRDLNILTDVRRSFDHLVQEQFPELPSQIYRQYVTKGEVVISDDEFEEDQNETIEPTEDEEKPDSIFAIEDIEFQHRMPREEALKRLEESGELPEETIVAIGENPNTISTAQNVLIGQRGSRRLPDFALLEAHATLPRPEKVLTTARDDLWALYTLFIFTSDPGKKARYRRLIYTYHRPAPPTLPRTPLKPEASLREPEKVVILGPHIEIKSGASKSDVFAILQNLGNAPFEEIEALAKNGTLLKDAEECLIGKEKKNRVSLKTFALEIARRYMPPEGERIPRKKFWLLYILYLFGNDAQKVLAKERIKKASEPVDRKPLGQPFFIGPILLREGMSIDKAVRQLTELGRLQPRAIVNIFLTNGDIAVRAENVFIGQGTDAISLRRLVQIEAQSAIEKPNALWAVAALAIFGTEKDRKHDRVIAFLDSLSSTL